jgi:RsiW-degrading membrane proteinase PrsW (M82 family)
MTRGRDPVERASDGEDLQEIATWEPRTRLDRFAHGLSERLLPAVRGIVLVAALLFTAIILIFSAVDTPRLPFVGMFALLSVVPALVLAGYVYRIDVTTREPPKLLLATFALAFVFASFAAIVNTAAQGIFFAFGAIGIVAYYLLVVGLGEELVKVFAVQFYAYNDARFDAVIDGAVYGAVAGLGFATIENAIYVTGFVQAATTGTLVDQTVTIAQRRALAGPGHVIYSAIAGYYLGLAKFNDAYRGAVALKGVLVAAAIHAIYNLSVGFAPQVVGAALGVSSLIGFVLFVVAFDGVAGGFLFLKLHRYRRTYDAVDAGATYDPSAPVDRVEFDAPTTDHVARTDRTSSFDSHESASDEAEPRQSREPASDETTSFDSQDSASDDDQFW